MKDKIKIYIDKARAMLSKLSSSTKKLAIITISGILIVSVAAALLLNNRGYEVLFTGLNEQDASEIIGKLQESAIDYKYENDGTILVPADQEQKLKAQLVYEGYPKSGFTYNVFKDNIDCKIKLKIDVQPIAAKRLHSKATSTVLCELAMAKPSIQTLNARLKSRKIRLIINFESNRIMYSPQKGGNKAPKKNNKEIISAVFFISLSLKKWF